MQLRACRKGRLCLLDRQSALQVDAGMEGSILILRRRQSLLQIQF